jgi:hypothetical protein
MLRQDKIRYWKRYRAYLIKWVKKIDRHISKLKQ